MIGATTIAGFRATIESDAAPGEADLTTQVDFTHAGDLKVFATTEEQIQSVERQMAETIATALRTDAGSVLAFLPGVGEEIGPRATFTRTSGLR